ncbi:MAG: YdcF family protein [Clostridia bacterium]|nr:YdcF family protein [Clostridia bacterium]
MKEKKKVRPFPDGRENRKKERAPLGRGEKILFGCCVFLGVFIFVLFFAYRIRQFIFSEGLSAALLADLMCLFSLLPLFCYRPLRKKREKLALVLLWIYFFLALFFFVTFVIHVFQTVIFPPADTPLSELSADPVILVFGAKITGAGPGVPLRRRLDAACELLSSFPDAVCVVSGGQGADEPRPEAEVMRDYLVSSGIDPGRIFCESESSDTVSNIENSLALMREEGLSERQLVCVSTRFHLRRILSLFSERGMTPAVISADSPTVDALVFSVIREYCSRLKLALGV